MQKLKNKKSSEKSFTLLETILALGIMTTVILEVVKTQGNIVYFSNYTRKMSQAMWLAKHVMTRVEYNYSQYDLKDLDINIPDGTFRQIKPDFDYSYKLNIEEWKLPIIDLIANGGIPSADEEDDEPKEKNPQGDMIGNLLKQQLGDHILKIANVEVSWPEGAKRDSVNLTYLLTNQRGLDERILSMESVAKKLEAKVKNEKNPQFQECQEKMKSEPNKWKWENNKCVRKR